MIEEVISLGNIILGDLKSDEDFLKSIIQQLKDVYKGKPTLIAKIHFFTDKREIKLDITEEVDETTALKYLYVGSADGSNSPQWFASTPSLPYILTETIPNLCRPEISFIPEDSTLSQKLKKIKDIFYIPIKDYLIQHGLLVDDIILSKYQYFLDLDNVLVNGRKLVGKPLHQFYKEIYEGIQSGQIKEKKPLKKLLSDLSSNIEKAFSEMFDIKKEQIALYVIYIDNQPIVKDEYYKKAVMKYKQNFNKITKGRSEKDSAKGIKKIGNICYSCLSDDNLSDGGFSSKTEIKFFTTNQMIFASGVDKKNYNKNMILCVNCIKKLMAGEVFLKKNLRTRLGTFDVYVLPHFVYTNVSFGESELTNLAEKIRNSLITAWNYESIEKFRDEVKGLLQIFEEDSYFLVNLVFFREVNAGTKILRYIPDINPSVFDRIYAASQEVTRLYGMLFSADSRFKINLQSVYLSIPVRLGKRGDSSDTKNILQIYDAIFSQRKISKRAIIGYMTDAIGIIQQTRDGYNISFLGNQELSGTILRMVFLIRFLEYLGCFEEEDGMDVSCLNLPDDMKEFITQMKFDEQKTALFLLGVLIGEIGNKQYQSRKEMDNQKPILNKLNFNGIDKSKLIRLIKDIFAKLKQEKILQYTEVIFAEMKRLFDKNIENWQYDKDENLFYILSGYAYKTQKSIISASTSKSEQIEI